ncbi:MAG: hypothetical protein ACJ8AT_22170 [Hyalangium sp.]|uniref:hypothetical protein n=1 Tax=Hyalangium sp. TaxID=2028555 RepID=UPI00389ADD59
MTLDSLRQSMLAGVNSPGRRLHQLSIVGCVLALACSGTRLYYLTSELPSVKGRSDVMIAPGPWPAVPAVLASPDSVPDDLVLPTLKALMNLPGAADSCDAWGQPRPDASEYCVAVYRTPEDWRVTWPIRNLVDRHNACVPPYGGVDDADFGRGWPVFGYAHNHPCGLFASSEDLKVFPAAKTPEGAWVFVGYATTPSGEPAHDSRGQVVAAWAWLATGHREEPRFYKWNPAGKVFRWSEDQKQWEFQATCKPQLSPAHPEWILPPKCAPELVDWY